MASGALNRKDAEVLAEGAENFNLGHYGILPTTGGFIEEMSRFAHDGFVIFESRINIFTPKVDFFTSKVDSFTPEVDIFTREVDIFTPEVDLFTREVDSFTPEVDIFTPEVYIFTPSSQHAHLGF